MLELVFMVCSILEGAHCHTEQPIRLAEGTGMIGCMMAVQVEGANYVAAHPNWSIARGTCQPAGKFADL